MYEQLRPQVVEDFVRNMETAGVGVATQSNAFDKLASILLDAHRMGIFDENPIRGVKPPQYTPSRSIIPTPSQLAGIRSSGDDSFQLLVGLISGCGMRNGEAAAVNIRNIVADDVYGSPNRSTRPPRGTAHSNTEILASTATSPFLCVSGTPSSSTPTSTEAPTATSFGTPRTPTRPFQPYLLQNQWQRLMRLGELGIPDGVVICSLRHSFASNCLSHGIPITDVADWMGHKSIDVTFKTYRHLTPGTLGKAARVLDLGLAA
ncbi:tyrosine-type recombinase/integrase [Streptomyces goshikiensis]|uniref:tyrosine-type recombinase/integrase n=1 Tax=Streptomyces goshikiensis TaxID=1942 RepID=UPI003714F3B3